MKFDRIVLQVRIDCRRCMTWRHTFKMSAMTSARRLLLHMQQSPPAARRARVTSLTRCIRYSSWSIVNSYLLWHTAYYQGLEDQLLSVIVKYERLELEHRRETLIQETRSDGCIYIDTSTSASTRVQVVMNTSLHIFQFPIMAAVHINMICAHTSCFYVGDVFRHPLYE